MPDILYKKLLYRSWYRGCKETDILLGSFARSELSKLTSHELHQYAQLLEADDADLFSWLTGQVQVPAGFNTAVFQKVIKYHQ